MNHYKARMVCAKEVQSFVAKYPNADYREFVIGMDLKYGIGESMIKKKLQQYNLQVQGGKLVKVDV